MTALAFLIFFVGYCWLMTKLAKSAYHGALEQGVSRFLAHLLAGLVVIVGVALVFWDAIPTWYTHYNLCKTEAGFKVYQTPEEWVKANPERFAQAMAAGNESSKTSKVTWSESSLGFEYEYYYELDSTIAFNTHIMRRRVIDKHTNKNLFEMVDFFSFAGRNSLANGATSLADYKFWTVTGSCQTAYPSLLEKFKYNDRTYTDFLHQIKEWHDK